MPYDYIEEYQKQDDETIWLFRDKDAQEKIDTSLTETEYANPLSLITDNAQNAIDTKIKIDPIQDLHGFDKPWVGGAGKNLLPNEITTKVDRNITFTTLDDGRIKITGTATGEVFANSDICENYSLPEGNYIISYEPVTNISVQICNRAERVEYVSLSSYDPVKSFTVTAEMVNNMRVRFITQNGKTVNGITGVMVRQASVADDAFAPYENICPISGHDQIDILGCGKNLFDKTKAVSNYRVVTTDGTLQGMSDGWHVSDYTEVKSNTIYTMNFVYYSAADYGMAFYDINKVYISGAKQRTQEGDTSFTFTTPNNCRYIRFTMNDITDIDDVQVELGSTATTYEPYTISNNLSIDLPSIVYGGVLDLESGELVVDRGIVDLGSIVWKAQSMKQGNIGFITENLINNLKSTGDSSIAINAICSGYEVLTGDQTYALNIGISQWSTGQRLSIYDAQYSSYTATDFQSAMDGVQLCYELSTPITLHISPEHLKLLKAQNNLTTSQYTQIKVTYRNGVFATLEELSDATQDIYDEISGDTTTVSGNPINFTTREKQKSKSTIIDLEPIQDLHGFTKPWVGGAGKNLLPLTVESIKARNSGMTWNGNSTTFNNVTFTILTDSDNNVIGIKANGTAQTSNANLHLPIPSINLSGHIINGCPSGGGTNTYYIRIAAPASTYFSDYGSGATITNNQVIVDCWIGVPVGGSANNLIFKPMLRLSSATDATFEPYTNIASISGRSSVDIDGCGKNLIDSSNAISGLINVNIGSSIDDIIATTRYSHSVAIDAKDGLVVTAKSKDVSVFNYLLVMMYNNDKLTVKYQMDFTDTISIKSYIVPSNTYEKVCLDYGAPNGGIVGTDISGYIQIEQGSTSTSYEPYTPSTDLTISFGQTVYSGRLDVEKGELVVDRSYVEFDGSSDENWTIQNHNGNYRHWIILNGSNQPTDVAIKTSLYESYTFNNRTYSKNNIAWLSPSTECTLSIMDSAQTTNEDWVNYLSSNLLQVCYYLITPQTLQLTPQQVQLLKGINNISTTGTTITVIFKNGSVAHLDDLPDFTDYDKEKLASIDTLAVTLDLLTHTLVVTQDV